MLSFKGTFCISTPVLTDKNRQKIMKKYDRYQMKMKSVLHKNDVNETYISVPDSNDAKMSKLLSKLDIPHYYFNPAQRLDKNEIYQRITVDELEKIFGIEKVVVDVEKLDNILKQDSSFYVGYKGVGGSKEKYENFREFLHTKNSIEPPIISLTKSNSGKVITVIEDGRHRFAVLRDMGFKKLPVRMNKESAALAKQMGIIAET